MRIDFHFNKTNIKPCYWNQFHYFLHTMTNKQKLIHIYYLYYVYATIEIMGAYNGNTCCIKTELNKTYTLICLKRTINESKQGREAVCSMEIKLVSAKTAK